MAKSDKKYWCKICKRYHKNRETYLQHKERFEKRKVRKAKKKDVVGLPKPSTIVKSPTMFVSDDPIEIANHLMEDRPVKIVATHSTAKKVEKLMPKTAWWDVKKIPAITSKPGQGSQHVKQMSGLYDCEDCEYYLELGKALACKRWRAPGFEFSTMKDKKLCMQFRRKGL